MTAEILRGFPHKTALVVGDICLDRWCTYDPALSDTSRETGIPSISVVANEVTPGAGGTVASNLVALGIGRVAVLGAIGDDGYGHELTRALSMRGISPELLVQSNTFRTFTYTKLINARTGMEDKPRVDFINSRPLPEDAERQILTHLRTFASAFDVIFVADQAEAGRGGAVTLAMRNLLSDLARTDSSKVIWVDSRVRSGLFRGVILKPNQEEADSMCEQLIGCVDYRRVREALGAKALFVTRGPNGVTVVDDNGQTDVPTRPNPDPVDVCGAGDSFSAGAGVALAITGSTIEAARFGNLVASITITKKGTGTASPQEVLAAEAG